MRMNEKVSSGISYAWNGLIGFFGGISSDSYMIIISLLGVLITAFINNYWQKKRFNMDYRGKDESK